MAPHIKKIGTSFERFLACTLAFLLLCSIPSFAEDATVITDEMPSVSSEVTPDEESSSIPSPPADALPVTPGPRYQKTTSDENRSANISLRATSKPLNFRVTKEGNSYVATFGGGKMVVNNAKAFGVDVSIHNGKIDWKKAKADGVDFAILRLGWGSYGEKGGDGLPSTDARFIENYKGAKAAGVKVGIYLYSYAGWKSTGNVKYWVDYAQKEADHVTTVLKQQGIASKDLDYPIYYDLEEPYLENATLKYGGETISNRTFLARIAKTFCDRIGAAGYKVGIYSNLNWWNNFLTDSTFNSWERWVARYPSKGATNQGSQYKGTHAVWQAHSEAYVEGIGTSDIDFDYLDRGSGSTTKPPIVHNAPKGSVYRLYNPNNGAHHFTMDSNEANKLVEYGWNDEGVAWKSAQEGAPVYRVYNPSNGDHLYVIRVIERDKLVNDGWIDEGICFYSYGKTPVYRLFNPNLSVGSHLYTSNQRERDSLVPLGWQFESIEFIAE